MTKKSTVFFLVANITIMLIPIGFMLALRTKINNGEVVDIVAKRKAEIFTLPLDSIHEIVINGQYLGYVNVNIELDSINNELQIDTFDYRYLTVSKQGKTLRIVYDYAKDSAENYSEEIRNGVVTASFSPNRRIMIALKNSLTKLAIEGVRCSVESRSNDYTLLSDLELNLQSSEFSIGTETYYDDYDYEVTEAMSDNNSNFKQDSLLGRLLLKADNSSVEIKMYYAPQISATFRNSRCTNFFHDYKTLDLKIDTLSEFYLDVSKLYKSKITKIN